MSSFQTVNPKNGAVLRTYEEMAPAEVQKAIGISYEIYGSWHLKPVADRTRLIARLGDLLEAEAPRLGALATDEMGKPITQATGEAKKCAVACRYYADHAAKMLADEPIEGDPGVKSYIAYRPIGPVLCIMPWNFPYWQVIRFAVPALAAGNTVLLKHAENTTGVALEIQKLFAAAGFPEGAFQTLLLGHDGLKDVIKDPRVQAVSLTGSERAGSSVAATAGSVLKKTVLELGGSDAYIVLSDADLEKAAAVCADARFVNSGQSCVAAKRFIVEAPVYDRFLEAFTAKAKAKKVGDPAESGTDIGPLAKPAIRDDVSAQVQKTLAKGARAVLGGKAVQGPGTYYETTVLDGVAPGMACFDEEVFGPVAAMIRAKDAQDALRLANLSRYGLGGAIFSRDVARAEELAAKHLEAGFTVVNGQVASDPRLPFGGVKLSGYGRELSWVGLREFVNVKTVVVHRA